MKLFNIFRKPNTPSRPVESAVAPVGESTTMQAPKEEKGSDVISITYGTGMPIDVIYAFVSHDYEQDGYQDALVNSDAEYCTAKETIIS